MSNRTSRRFFLQVTAATGAGLVIGCHVPPAEEPRVGSGDTAKPPATDTPKAGPPADPFAPNAWVRVAPDGWVTVIIDKAEMGQGVETSLSMLVAEELEADWSKVRTEFAPVDPVKYVNPVFGMQATGGSTSVQGSYKPLRAAGAAARMMLVSAAARTWSVDESTCRAEKGEVIHTPTGRKLGYGALVAEAAKSKLPEKPELKDPSAFRLIGKKPPRLDGPAKAMGRAQFGLDVRQPNMLTAVIVRSPAFGGTLKSFDAAKAQAVKGVRKVFRISNGVAVVAEGYWPARKGAEALTVEWDIGKNADKSSETLTRDAVALAKKPGKVAQKAGDAEKALKAAAKKIEAVYEMPYQAHAPMEPQNCTALVRDDGCEVWAPTQFPAGVRMVAAKLTGLDAAKINVHTTFLGGGFGRRFEQDFVAEAVEVAKEMKGVPVKVAWSREDDIRHDFYRPASYNVLRAGIGKDNTPVAWTHRIVSPSVFSRVFPTQMKDGIDHAAVEGAIDLPYGTPNVLVDYQMHDTGIPVGFWRSVGHSLNAFITESFFDEVAALGKQDPYELRKKLMTSSPRLLGALELAATKAGWGKPLGAGVGRGIAAHASFGSFVAQVAEVTVDEASGAVKVNRVVCAIDCGAVVNPDILEAQVEGSIVYGLSAALKGQITIEKGGVKQANFHNFRILKIDEMPVVEVHIVPSKEPSTGAGEPATAPIAAAVGNAIFAVTGKRIRSLPIKPADLKRGA